MRVIGTARAVTASLSVSPDGMQLAFLARDDTSGHVELRVIPTTGSGSSRTVFRPDRGRIGPPVTWMPDGSGIVFKIESGGQASLWPSACAEANRSGCCPIAALRTTCGYIPMEDDSRLHPAATVARYGFSSCPESPDSSVRANDGGGTEVSPAFLDSDRIRPRLYASASLARCSFCSWVRSSGPAIQSAREG